MGVQRLGFWVVGSGVQGFGFGFGFWCSGFRV